MNKVKIEPNSDGKTYVVTLPDGGQRHSMSAQEVIKSLGEKAQEFQKAIDDINLRIEEFKKIAAKS